MGKTKTDKKDKKKEAPKEEKPPTKKALCIEGHEKGMTNEEIAEYADTTINSVRWYLSKEGLSAHRAEKVEED